MKLRKHQQELLAIIDDIIAGSSITKIIVSACPGSGKSALPIIAGKLITAGLVDALCWVVPRLALQKQGEANFQDPLFRKILKHKLAIRSSTNSNDPCRGLSGFVTTYQAMAVDDNQTVLSDFKRKRYVLILDEFHHLSLEADAAWSERIKLLVDHAEYVVFMTGTMERGSGNKIAFLPYDQVDDKIVPKLESDETTAVITYTRSDALTEKAILPLSFHLSGGDAEWIDKDGAFRKSGISQAPADIASQALFTAISTEFAETLLEAGVTHWQSLKKYNKNAKLMVVTANYKEAQRISKKLKSKWFNSEIATSHESKHAQQAIKKFKSGSVDILVAINMIYEGLDVPEATHIICLTNIRSNPWIEQMVARVVRVDPQAGPYESQVGYIFAPDDILFRKIVAKIEREQKPFVRARKKTQLSLFKGEGEWAAPNIQIQPLSSTMNGHREVFLGERSPMPYMPQTPSEVEDSLRHCIENHVRIYSFNNRYQNGGINTEIKKHFGKARAEMTSDELDAVYGWVKETYPIERLGRGSGRTRVSTVARPWL